LITANSTASFDVSQFSVLPEGYQLDETFYDGGWHFDELNGSLEVRFSAIPEPETAFLATAGLLFFAAAGRLRGRKASQAFARV